MEFKANIDAVKEALSACKILIETNAKEQQLRDTFTSHLRRMFPETPSPWWIEDHIQRCESNTLVTVNGKIKRGFVDNLVGRTVIEYERNLRSAQSFKSGYGQIKEYGVSLIRQGNHPDDIVGVLSDTINWFAYGISIKIEFSGIALENISPEHIDLEELSQLDLSIVNDESATRLSIFLNQYLGRIGSRQLSAQFIARDLGLSSQAFQKHGESVLSVVKQAFNTREDYANLIQKLWTDFVVYLGDNVSGNKFDVVVYANELYILALSKLICANCISGKGLISTDYEIRAIMNGEFFRAMGILNLVEYDYFGWLSESPSIDNLVPIAQDLQKDIQAYNYSDEIKDDLFGELMSQLATRTKRLLLGQEWTPHWLAKKIVDNTISNLPNKQYPVFVDMCCGSGAMAVQVIENVKHRILKEKVRKDKAIKLICQSFTGFDIDPMAVLLAKISWLLAAKELLPLDNTTEITIPIYNADSLFAITAVSKDIGDQTGTGILILQLADQSVSMPEYLVSTEFSSIFDQLIESGYRHGVAISNNQKTKKISKSILNEAVQMALHGSKLENNAGASSELVSFLDQLISAISNLQRAGLNGLWAFLLRNSYRPGLVFGNFNGLVSNPPWLTLSKVSDNPYKSALRLKSDALSITPEGSSHPHLEMATIFLLHSIDKYLMDGASIGCILPETILNGQHHKKFRDGRFLRSQSALGLDISEIWRIEKGSFKNEALALFGYKENKAEIFSPPVKGRRVSHLTPDEPIQFNLLKLGDRSAWSEKVSNTISVRSNNYKFRQGADIMPRSIFLFDSKKTQTTKSGQILYKISGISDSLSPNRYLLSDSKKCKDFRLSSQIVPEMFLFDAFISKQLSPFHISPPAKAFLPARRDEDGWSSINESEIINWSGARAAFKEITDAYESEYNREVTLTDLLNNIDSKRKKLTTDQKLIFSGYIVLFGAGGSNPCASYISSNSTQANRLVIDQTLYWVQVETEQEAIYLTAIINSDSLKKIIKAFQPKGQQGERHIHTLPLEAIPDFDRNNLIHRNIVDSTRTLLHELNAELQTNQLLISQLDPNKNLATRRRFIMNEIRKFKSFEEYDMACKRLLFA